VLERENVELEAVLLGARAFPSLRTIKNLINLMRAGEKGFRVAHPFRLRWEETFDCFHLTRASVGNSLKFERIPKGRNYFAAQSAPTAVAAAGEFTYIKWARAIFPFAHTLTGINIAREGQKT
jgi:hypothetical protein